MGLTLDMLKRLSTLLVGFFESIISVEGVITLPIEMEIAPRVARMQLNFLMVKVPSAYNAILGRSGLNIFRAVVSFHHLMMKFPTKDRVGEVRGNQIEDQKYYAISLQEAAPFRALPLEDLDTYNDLAEEHGKPVEDLIKIPLDPGQSEKTIQIGSYLSEAGQ